MHRVYFRVGESGGPKHAPHEIFSEIDLAKFLLTQLQVPKL